MESEGRAAVKRSHAKATERVTRRHPPPRAATNARNEQSTPTHAIDPPLRIPRGRRRPGHPPGEIATTRRRGFAIRAGQCGGPRGLRPSPGRNPESFPQPVDHGSRQAHGGRASAPSEDVLRDQNGPLIRADEGRPTLGIMVALGSGRPGADARPDGAARRLCPASARNRARPSSALTSKAQPCKDSRGSPGRSRSPGRTSPSSGTKPGRPTPGPASGERTQGTQAAPALGLPRSTPSSRGDGGEAVGGEQEAVG